MRAILISPSQGIRAAMRLRHKRANVHYTRRILFSNQEEIAFVLLKDLMRIEAHGNCSLAFALGHPKRICVTPTQTHTP